MTTHGVEIAHAVAELWQEALGLDDVALDDDFFDLGGNSITVIRMAPLIAARFGVEPTMAMLFDHPTPSALATALESLIIATSGSAARTRHPDPHGG